MCGCHSVMCFKVLFLTLLVQHQCNVLHKGMNIYLSSSLCCSDLREIGTTSACSPVSVCQYVFCILCPSPKAQHMSALARADRNALLYCGGIHGSYVSCPKNL